MKRAGLQPVPPVSAQIVELLAPVSHTDLYCAGFVTPQAYPRNHFVMGGLNSPHASQFVRGEDIFLAGGGFQPGTRVSIVREIRDPNRLEVFPGQNAMLKATGLPYAELGYADIIEIRGDNAAVARVELSCDSIFPGDLVIPFTPKQEVSTRIRSELDRYPAEAPKLSGRIVLGRDFDQFGGSGRKVYLNVGGDKGVKAGDYFKVTRTYQPGEMDIADRQSLKAVIWDDTQHNPAPIDKKQLDSFPRRVIAELIVLNVTPTSAAAMVTFATEEIHVGDVVELE